jgi:hypothetical protein
VIAVAALPLAAVALEFGPAENFSLVLGLVASFVLAHGSLLKAIAMIVLGLLLGMIGTDSAGAFRFTFGVPELTDGIGFAVVAMGIGVAEIVVNLRHQQNAPAGLAKVGRLVPAKADIRAAEAPTLRGSVLGSALGILPGGGLGMIKEQSTLFCGLIASMWIGNAFLVMLNLPLVGVWASLPRTDPRGEPPARPVVVARRSRDLRRAADQRRLAGDTLSRGTKIAPVCYCGPMGRNVESEMKSPSTHASFGRKLGRSASGSRLYHPIQRRAHHAGYAVRCDVHAENEREAVDGPGCGLGNLIREVRHELDEEAAIYRA